MRRRPKGSIYPFMISDQGGVSGQGPVSLSDISLSVITCLYSQPLVSSHYQDLFTIRLPAFCPVSICRYISGNILTIYHDLYKSFTIYF